MRASYIEGAQKPGKSEAAWPLAFSHLFSMALLITAIILVDKKKKEKMTLYQFQILKKLLNCQ